MGIHLLAVAVGVTAWAAIVVVGIATTGRLTRWLPARPRRAPDRRGGRRVRHGDADGLGVALLAA